MKRKFKNMKHLIKKVRNFILFHLPSLGFDITKIRNLSCYKCYLRFRRERKEWLEKGGKITRNFMILYDYEDQAGTDSGHYFHQDLLVAKLIFENNPHRHVDVASRIDGFVAHVASFREIEVFDIRPLRKSVHKNIKFIQADLMNPKEIGEVDSISCLHAIEHFGLGRYNDPIDIDGHKKGIDNWVSMLTKGGLLYLSTVVGIQNEVHFNAHRIFHPKWMLEHRSIAENMKLIRFDFVDDRGDLHLDDSIDSVTGHYSCGIYTFEKL